MPINNVPVRREKQQQRLSKAMLNNTEYKLTATRNSW